MSPFLAALAMLQGCAASGFAASGLATVIAGGTMAVNPDYAPLAREVTNQVKLPHQPPQVYATLLVTVERNGRKIAALNPAAFELNVTYPFSWQSNHWGGVLTLTCAPNDDSTLLTIVGSGRDSTARLRLIGDEIIADLRDALALLPTTP